MLMTDSLRSSLRTTTTVTSSRPRVVSRGTARPRSAPDAAREAGIASRSQCAPIPSVCMHQQRARAARDRRTPGACAPRGRRCRCGRPCCAAPPAQRSRPRCCRRRRSAPARGRGRARRPRPPRRAWCRSAPWRDSISVAGGASRVRVASAFIAARRGRGRVGPVAEPVGDQNMTQWPPCSTDRPGVAADRLAGLRQAHGADLERARPVRHGGSVPRARATQRGAVARARVDVELVARRAASRRGRCPGCRRSSGRRAGLRPTFAMPGPDRARAPRCPRRRSRSQRAQQRSSVVRRASRCWSRPRSPTIATLPRRVLVEAERPRQAESPRARASADLARVARSRVRAGGAQLLLPSRDRDARALAELRVDLELVRQPLGAAQARGPARRRSCSRPSAPARCPGCPGPGPRR